MPNNPSAMPPALWKRAATGLGAIQRALGSPSPEARLDSQLSKAIARNDKSGFERLLTSTRFPAPNAPDPLPSDLIPQSIQRALDSKRLPYLIPILNAAAHATQRPLAELASRVIHQAAGHGSCQSLELLLAHGANPNALDSQNRLPLTLAIIAANLRSAEALIRAGSPVNIPDDAGLAPLDHALGSFPEDDPLMANLINAEISLNSLNHFSQSLIAKARLVQTLLNAGARPSASSEPLLLFAIRFRHQPLLNALSSRGLCSPLLSLFPLSPDNATALPAQRWLDYACQIGSRDPLIQDFLTQAIDQERLRAPVAATPAFAPDPIPAPALSPVSDSPLPPAPHADHKPQPIAPPVERARRILSARSH